MILRPVSPYYDDKEQSYHEENADEGDKQGRLSIEFSDDVIYFRVHHLDVLVLMFHLFIL